MAVADRSTAARSAAPEETIEDLDRAILGRSFRLNAATCELLVLIRRLDERAGWLIDKALDRARDDNAARYPEFAHESFAQKQADALVAMARSYLAGDTEGGGTPDHYQVLIDDCIPAATANENDSKNPSAEEFLHSLDATGRKGWRAVLASSRPPANTPCRR